MKLTNHRVQPRGQQFDDALPHDIEAERAVLAVVLLDPRRISDVIVALEPADFADRGNRSIYGAMLRLQQRGLPTDATLVVGELHDYGQYNVAGGVSAATLIDLFQLFPRVVHLPHYVDRVLKMAHRRHEMMAPGR